MARMTSTGAKLEVALGRPAAQTATAYDDPSMEYDEIGFVTNIPAFGPSINPVASQPLATGITEYFTGFTELGEMNLEAEFDDDDAGQEVVLDATTFGSSTFGKEFSFRLTMPSGTKFYWVGRFFSSTVEIGSADQMVGTSLNVRVNTQIVRKKAE